MAFPYFEPGSPVNKLQIRCWKRPEGPLDLVSSAGHEAVFPGRKVFPIRFLLRHYPFRSQSHAERKLFLERRPRYAKAEKTIGWHVQYEDITEGHLFVRPPEDLERFDAERVRVDLQVGNRAFEEALAERDAVRQRVEELRTDLEGMRRERDELRAGLEEICQERDAARAETSRILVHLLERDREIEEKDEGISKLIHYLEQSEAARAAAKRKVIEVHGSWSWRLTRPIRLVFGWFARRRTPPDDSGGIRE
jgi:hypothetical protein